MMGSRTERSVPRWWLTELRREDKETLLLSAELPLWPTTATAIETAAATETAAGSAAAVLTAL